MKSLFQQVNELSYVLGLFCRKRVDFDWVLAKVNLVRRHGLDGI